MNWLHAVLLGVVEGVTEFLPISSTGHLNVVEKLLGYEIDSKGMTAFTAIIQVGAIIAAIVYFAKDIWRIILAFFAGLADKGRRDNADYRLGWGVILGSIPVAVVGLLFKHQIETSLRSLWVIIGALVGWSVVMWIADRRNLVHERAGDTRGMADVRIQDAVFIGLFQALSPLFPGISRSGATISAGMFRRFDRVTATRLSFFLGIPALVAAGGLEAVTAADDVAATVGWNATIIATVVSFVVAYAAIAWLLRYVSKNTFTAFIVYRLVLAAILVVLLLTNTITA